MAMMEETPRPAHYDDSELISLIQFHSIDMLVGGFSSAICALTLLVFISSKHFLCHNKLLTLLAVADLCTSAGILILGFMRKALYEQVMETSRIPVETPWSCAAKPFVYLRLVGALIPPLAVLWISIERFLAVFTPNAYRQKISPNSHLPPIGVLLYTILAMVVAYSISWHNRIYQVEAYCGRKNAFSRTFTTYVYLADIFGFFFALLVNCVTLCRLIRLYAQRQHRFEVRKQLKRIHYLLVISFVSTLTVAIPNGISLASAWFGRLNIAFSDPANWMIAAKCSINPFVYLLLKAEFRQRIYEILGCLGTGENSRIRRVSAFGLPNHNGIAVVDSLNQRLPRDSIVALADMMGKVNRSAEDQQISARLDTTVGGRGRPISSFSKESIRRAWTTRSQPGFVESA